MTFTYPSHTTKGCVPLSSDVSFRKLNEEMNATILMVTHDAFTASYCKRILFIKDGKLFNELIRGTESRKEFFDRIMEVIALLGGDLNAE